MITLPTIMGIARSLHLAATLSLLGTLGFLAWILPAASVVPEPLRHQLTRVWWVSGLTAILAGVAWFALQAATIADAENLSDLLGALPLVALHTRYGNVVLVRLGLLAVATEAARIVAHIKAGHKATGPVDDTDGMVCTPVSAERRWRSCRRAYWRSRLGELPRPRYMKSQVWGQNMGVGVQRILIIIPALVALAGCISSSSPAPPARNTTIVVPPGSTAVCSNGTAPPC